MRQYNVYLEVGGKQVRVGKIEGNYSEDACFSYSKEYVSKKESKAISISLPIQDEPFSPERTKAFFEGLLPEGFMRRNIAANMHFDDNDYLSILYNLGKDQKVLDHFEKAIKESGKELQDIGFDNAGNIVERILLARKKIL